MNRKSLLLAVVFTALFISACSSGPPHRVADEEFDSTFAGQKFSNLLVLGVYEDRTFRVSSETTLAEALKARGVTASPSYDVLPNTQASAEQIQSALAAGNFDGVLTVATIDPGYDYDAGDYFATRGMVYMLGGEPGAATDIGSLVAWAGSGYYELFVGLWDAATGKPVWVVTTDSADTGSESSDLKALADMIVMELQKKGAL